MVVGVNLLVLGGGGVLLLVLVGVGGLSISGLGCMR